ncbi:protein Mis18-alpha [Polymixia lowei]
MAARIGMVTLADVKRRQKVQDTTFDDSITESHPPEELSNQVEYDEDNDGPVVFICGKCKLPVGDSLSWAGSEDDLNQIHLKRVTDNVLVGKETHIYEPIKRASCLIAHLTCRGCHSFLGMVYVSTPKSLDSKRFMFCLNVADIESYMLGSANQVVAAESPKEPVTLEYRSIVEQQLTEMKTLVVSMAQRLEDIEAGLQE